MSRLRISIIILGSLLLALFAAGLARAQIQGGGWSEPYLLSSGAGKANEAHCTGDQYGYVHCFWTETLFADQRTIIQYARFDGETWSTPTDIHLTGIGIARVSPVVDQTGTLHIVWAEGLNGPAYHTYAPANDTLSAQKWARPRQIDIPARVVQLHIDDEGVFHLVYINQVQIPGVYYVRSEDQGLTWSDPLWLDPDILPDHIPDSLSFEMDQNGNLHVAWFYGALEQGLQPDWVRYVHSLDGGDTWSQPFLIDEHDVALDHSLQVASPVMEVIGETVHIIWAAGSQPYRMHRYSSDAGRTWGPATHILGELHGQAFDGLVADGLGRLHFFGQIRYPVGIYHAYWEQGRWTPPFLVYLIAEGDFEEGAEAQVHAHHTHPVIRAGNQVVLTFGDGPADPNRRLFAVHRTLEDVPPSPLAPTPTPAAAAMPAPAEGAVVGQPLATATVEPTPTVSPVEITDATVEPVPNPNLAISVALIPTLLLIVAAIVGRLLLKLWS